MLIVRVLLLLAVLLCCQSSSVCRADLTTCPSSSSVLLQIAKKREEKHLHDHADIKEKKSNDDKHQGKNKRTVIKSRKGNHTKHKVKGKAIVNASKDQLRGNTTIQNDKRHGHGNANNATAGDVANSSQPSKDGHGSHNGRNPHGGRGSADQEGHSHVDNGDVKSPKATTTKQEVGKFKTVCTDCYLRNGKPKPVCDLVGWWSYDGLSFMINRYENKLFFVENEGGPHEVTGELVPDGDFMSATLSTCDGEVYGTIRIRHDACELVSSFRAFGDDQWSKEIVAVKVDDVHDAGDVPSAVSEDSSVYDIPADDNNITTNINIRVHGDLKVMPPGPKALDPSLEWDPDIVFPDADSDQKLETDSQIPAEGLDKHLHEVNWAQGKTVTCGENVTCYGPGLVDGIITADSWVNAPYAKADTCDDIRWVKVDLQKEREIHRFQLFLFYGDVRKYCGLKLETSLDGKSWTTLKDSSSDFSQPVDSRGIAVEANRLVRYARWSASRSDQAKTVEFLELQAWGPFDEGSDAAAPIS